MGKRVLITGAGSGLGRALALRHGARGDRVACADIALDRAEQTVAQIEAAGGKALALPVDIVDEAAWAALRERLVAEWGGLDLLYNNAGVASGGNTLGTPIDDWQWMLDVNLLGVVRGCRCFAPLMQQAGSGRIVNIASFAGLAGAPGLSSYGVAKASVVALSEGLRGELVDHGVGVSVACPAFFQTNLLENFRGSDGMRRAAARMMESSRLSADDIAAAIIGDVDAGRFLIIPTPGERRQWWIKRWFPEFYFRQLMKTLRRRSGKRG
jgi:NADP-dependent 3-hydroxy acid dehydrogenase YdfG